MKFAYIDESGISIHERVLTVAAVIIDADAQWRPVADHLCSLVTEFVPAEDREDFHFHATDLFHRPPRLRVARAHDALKEILLIPAQFHLGVAFGFYRKPPRQNMPGQPQKEIRRQATIEAHKNHAMAFAGCFLGVEMFMQDHCPLNEVATLIAENNTETGKTVKKVATSASKNIDARARRMASEWQAAGMPVPAPIRRIIDVPFMAEKTEASLLQIADACALVIRYCLEGRNDAQEFIDALSLGHPEKIHDNGKLTAPDCPAGYNVLTFRPR